MRFCANRYYLVNRCLLKFEDCLMEELTGNRDMDSEEMKANSRRISRKRIVVIMTVMFVLVVGALFAASYYDSSITFETVVSGSVIAFFLLGLLLKALLNFKRY